MFESPNQTSLDFCLWGWMKSEVYNRNVDTRDELLARTLDAAAPTDQRQDHVRRTARDLRTRVAKCTEFGGGIYERLF